MMKKFLAVAFMCISIAVLAEDPAKDKELFSERLKLAEQGNAETQFQVGRMCEKGQGVVQNFEEAAKWYQKAAEQGFVKAQHNVGVMYCNGSGVKQDYPEAMKWFNKAAEQGFVVSQLNIAMMYLDGEGVPKDPAQAYAWFSIAEGSGDKNAAALRTEMMKGMTPQQIEEGKLLSNEWLAKHPPKQ